MKRNKDSLLAVSIIGLVVIVIVTVFVLSRQERTFTTTRAAGQKLNEMEIKDVKGLDAATKELDKTDLEDLERGLNQLDNVTSSF